MILEVADIRIPPGKNAEFEAAIARGLETVLPRTKGFIRHQVHRGIDSPERYLLMIWWQALENHTVDFRGSADFQEWRKLVGHCFERPPEVEHTTLAVHGFGRICG